MLRGTVVRVLLAVMALPSPTVRSVALKAGCGYGTATYHLARLKTLGLVDYEPHMAGTLRALVGMGEVA